MVERSQTVAGTLGTCVQRGRKRVLVDLQRVGRQRRQVALQAKRVSHCCLEVVSWKQKTDRFQ